VLKLGKSGEKPWNENISTAKNISKPKKRTKITPEVYFLGKNVPENIIFRIFDNTFSDSSDFFSQFLKYECQTKISACKKYDSHP